MFRVLTEIDNRDGELKPGMTGMINGRRYKVVGRVVLSMVADDGELIAGHGRVLAATMLGLTDVPVIRLGHLDEAERRAYRIADNKLTEAHNMLTEALFAVKTARSEYEKIDGVTSCSGCLPALPRTCKCQSSGRVIVRVAGC